jgi:uncharacterized protein
MPEYLAPGVFVEEVSFRSKSIEGVSTSTSAFVGSTLKGPLGVASPLITSFAEFERIYGSLGNLSCTAATDAAPDVPNYMAHAVRAFFENGGQRLYVVRSGDNDGTEPGIAAYTAALALLEPIAEISIIAAPGHSALAAASFAAVQQALIAHAEKMHYRVAVLDTPAGQTVDAALQTRAKINSSRAALYYPWVVIANPLALAGNKSIPREISLPPSGFVCGIYARTDITRGVWKAPANEIVRGALHFERDLTKENQDILNPQGVNCLRFFPGRGNLLWGARTASADPEWKYVNVRRYFIYLERSIEQGIQWVVFEPNGESLWANVRQTVSAFLTNEWRNGALLGTKPEQAFFVRCDRSTMTQNDIDNGRLICEIGVAPVKPAEFIIFRIGHKTADAHS